MSDERKQMLLAVRDLSVRYGEQVALHGVSLSLEAGGLILILGPNGAGKTSLVRSLAGGTRAASGSVVLDGHDVGHLPAHKRVKRGLALVPEGRGTLAGLSVEDNVLLGWHACPRARRASRYEDIAMIWDLFPELAGRRRQDCASLSGGEMQMVAIARGILAKPRVLLLDEPSLGLAPRVVSRVFDVLMQLNESGLSMLIVEQRAVPLSRPPTTSMVLVSGEMVYQEVNRRPSRDELAALYLGEGV